MKKIPVLSAIYLIALTAIVPAQTPTQFLTFNDNNGVPDAGTYNPNDSFSFDIFLTFSGYNSTGLSLWFETTAAAAPNIVLTGYMRGTTFQNGNGHHFPLPFTLLQSNGWYTNPDPSDLGVSVPSPSNVNAVSPGTYFIENLSVSLTGLASGTYILRSDAINPHVSEVTGTVGTSFADNNLPVSTYTITIVPEASTLGLLIMTAIGLGEETWRRALPKKLEA
jgi:hypothetical protein